MLELTEEASRAAPLDVVLASLCERVARMLAVDVCSIYLREASEPLDRRVSGDLVLHATWGYPQESVGRVRMRVGEGLTGFAVECLRPVSVARAATDARNKRFPWMDEERFPSLCAVPLVDGGRAVGAMVIQRRQPRAFGQREIVLAAAVTAPILFAIERARTRQWALEQVRPDAAPAAGRPHEVMLRGDGVAPGEALGTVHLRRHQPARPVRPQAEAHDVAEERARLGRALAETSEEMGALETWALTHAPLDRATMMQLLSPSRFVLDDARLRSRMMKQVEAGASAGAAVERVMREYTRLLSTSGDPVLAGRALEVEALCCRAQAKLDGPRPASAPGGVLCASRLTVCDAIELAAHHGVAAVLAGDAESSPGVAVAVALGLPVVAGISALFRWVADGDRVLVSGAAGTVTVNPSRVDVAAYRRR